MVGVLRVSPAWCRGPCRWIGGFVSSSLRSSVAGVTVAQHFCSVSESFLYELSHQYSYGKYYDYWMTYRNFYIADLSIPVLTHLVRISNFCVSSFKSRPTKRVSFRRCTLNDAKCHVKLVNGIFVRQPDPFAQLVVFIAFKLLR